MHRMVLLLWPSFLVSACLTALFFAFVDPADMTILGQPIELSRMTVYGLAFFICWAVCAASSWLTLFLEKQGAEVNGYCPVPTPHDHHHA